MSRTKANIPDGESKAEKFIRVGNPRIKRAIKYLRSVKTIVGSPAYEVSDVQLEQVVMTLQEEVDAIQSAFDARNKSKEEIPDVL